jgi:hypothetical protein
MSDNKIYMVKITDLDKLTLVEMCLIVINDREKTYSDLLSSYKDSMVVSYIFATTDRFSLSVGPAKHRTLFIRNAFVF